MIRQIILSGLLALSSPSSATPAESPSDSPPDNKAENYFGLILGSRHFGPDTQAARGLNDDTPGITVGRRYLLETEGLEAFIEAGVFYNSYRETSPVLLTGLTMRVAKLADTELRLGAFTGIGYYKELGQSLHEEYGIPYFKGFIPLAGLAVSIRHDRHELRLTTVPADDLKAIANLSYTFRF